MKKYIHKKIKENRDRIIEANKIHEKALDEMAEMKTSIYDKTLFYCSLIEVEATRKYRFWMRLDRLTTFLGFGKPFSSNDAWKNMSQK